jgi:hypothetical protein
MIKVSNFGGIAPIVDPAKLPERNAQSATYCKFEGGNLRPLLTAALQNSISYPFQTVNKRSIFQLGTNQWAVWAADVAAAKGPIPLNANYLGLGEDFRFYFCGDSDHAEQWPRFSSKFRAMGNSNPSSYFATPALDYPLGVPAPVASVTTELVAPASGTVSKLTKTKPVEAECSAAHGLDSGETVKLTGLPGSGDGHALEGAQSIITVTDTTHFKLNSMDGSLWAADLTGLSVTWTRVYADSEVEDRRYVLTYVNEFGEEGAPGPLSGIISVGADQGVTVTLPTGASITPFVGAPTFLVAKKRLYRSVAGTTAAQYLFVAELDIATLTYVDTLSAAQLGEVIPTENFDLPPANLKGIVLHPNGFFVGYDGNRLYFSEPYIPSAWPADYIRNLDFKITGLAIHGQTIVVGTEQDIYVGSCTDPQSFTERHLDQIYPCVDRRTMISTGFAVTFVSPVGLVSVDGSGARVITSGSYNRKQWQALITSGVPFGAGGLFACFQDGKYWLGIENVGLIMFDQRGEALDIVVNSGTVSGGFVNRPNDELYLVWFGLSEPIRRLYKWEGVPGSFYTATWRSKVFHMEREINLGYAQVIAPSYPGAGTMVFGLYADGVLIYVKNVTSREPFPLPDGYLALTYWVEIDTTLEIESIQVAQNVEELRRVAL